ncbi:MAG: FixH family protein [Anaerolineaceae bacterium]|nr:FixH family protein [Anaerolineaceae bacterium]MDE0328722.1 FixH family protein [Anaerolineaceae bacterium]
MRRTIFLILCLALVAACRQESTPAAEADLTISLRVLPTDARVGEAELLVDVTDADGRAVSPERVDVRGDMDHAGMQPVLRDDVQGSNGKYRVAFEWTMAGDWTVTVRLTFADDSVLEKTFDESVSQAVEEATPTPVPEDGEGPTPIPTLRGMGGISRGGAAAETPFGAWQGTPDRTQQAMTQEAQDAIPTPIPTLRGMGGISRGGAAAETPFGAWQDRSDEDDSESEEEDG